MINEKIINLKQNKYQSSIIVQYDMNNMIDLLQYDLLKKIDVRSHLDISYIKSPTDDNLE